MFFFVAFVPGTSTLSWNNKRLAHTKLTAIEVNDGPFHQPRQYSFIFSHRATTIHVLLFASFGYCTPKFAYLFFYLLNFLVTARTACSTDAWWQCWYGYLITLGWTYFKPYRLFYCTVYLFLLSRINAVKMKEENT